MACSAGPDVSESGLVLALDAADRYSFTLTEVEVLVVAGGGGGGMDMGGGGGGGGVIYNPNVTVTPGSAVTVTVGAGGAGAPAAGTNGQPGGHQYTISATNGGNSVFGALTAIGGGFGGSSYWGYTPNAGYGAAGGSGGGASGYKQGVGSDGRGGAGTAGQGFAGGGGSDQYYSGGGGGAGGAGVSGPNKPNGGPGVLYPSMSPYYFGGGGGGASYSLSVGGDGGVGGGGGGAVGTTYGGAGLNNGSPGGGGSPKSQTNTPGGNAGANTGGGGGGGAHYNSNNKGGDGGSGIVIVRYPGPQRAIGGTVTFSGGHTIHTFTTVGSATFTPLSASNGNTILGLSDLSNTGNFGTTANSPTYSSANGGSIVFNGTDEYVTTTLGTYTPYCIDIWFKNDDDITSAQMQGNYQNLLGVGSSPGGIALGNWTSTATDETFSFFSAGWSANGMTYIRDTASPGIHNLVVNWNGSSFDFWLDGTKRTTYASSYGHRTLETVTGFQIGSAYNNADSYEFDGSVYSVKVYVSQLTDAQVQQNFNSLRGRFGI